MCYIFDRFQFLIGTIKTFFRWAKTYFSGCLFQFLIGTIKTHAGGTSYSHKFPVSIPHRYDQNMGVTLRTFPAREVSIPHRYDQNLAFHSEQIVGLPGFQFLIGTIKTDLSTNEQMHHGFVSIPHRYDQNLTTQLSGDVELYKFQFLIGTIKTRARSSSAYSSNRCFNSS